MRLIKKLDDGSMLTFWMHRLQGHELFSHYEEALAWYKGLSTDEDVSFLVGYELDEKYKNGLSFLAQVKNKSRAYLITSHAEEAKIQEKVKEMGVGLIPKALISHLPVIEC